MALVRVIGILVAVRMWIALEYSVENRVGTNDTILEHTSRYLQDGHRQFLRLIASRISELGSRSVSFGTLDLFPLAADVSEFRNRPERI